MRGLAWDQRTLRFVRFMAIMSVLAALSLACMGEVPGERAMTGMCPPGETCSTATPAGLNFVGHAMYDQDVLQLGPILAGGRFDVGLRTSDGQPLPPFAFEVEDATVFQAALGTGPFGPTNDAGEPLYRVDGFLTLQGSARGTTFLRIVDPTTRELFDRLALDVYELTGVNVVLARDAMRTYLHEGCEEMIGVRLLANDGSTELRAFDQGVVIRAEGIVEQEPRFWDCVLYTVPAGRTEIAFEVDVAGQTFMQTLPVRTLASVGLSACPPRPAD